MLGNGTATSEHLSLYGLEATEKALVASVACGDMTRQLIKSAKRRLFIDIPGNGIMLAVPIKAWEEDAPWHFSQETARQTAPCRS